MRLLLISILAFSSSAKADIASEIPEGSLFRARNYDFAPVRDLALRILAEYPPDRYHYVGVGRAPTVLIAMFQAILGAESARNLPLSSMRKLRPPEKPEPNADGTMPEVPARLRFEDYTVDNLARLERHFTRVLPDSRHAIDDRKLLFVDWGHYGYTLTNLKREFEAQMSHRPAATRLTADFLALTDGTNALPTKLAGRGIRSMLCSHRDRYIIDVLYKNFSEYGQYSVTAGLDEMPRRRTRSVIRRQMRQEYATLFMPGVKSDMHFRDTRRQFYKKYVNVRSYDDLVAAYALKIGKDPYVRVFRERHGLIASAALSRLDRVRMKCEAAMGRSLPF